MMPLVVLGGLAVATIITLLLLLLLLLVTVLYAIFVLDLKIVQWEIKGRPDAAPAASGSYS